MDVTFPIFNNTYAKLPERFFERVKPERVNAPRLIRWNDSLGRELGLEPLPDHQKLAEIFSGQILSNSAEPLAMAYAGHQFGHFVPQLGDGRALLLGEIVNSEGRRFDIHLKGSGRTKFSRNGDGKAALGPVLREYLISEGMYHLKIPTTRSLAAITTGEDVIRENGPLPGAILARVASSHVRVGHFEYFAARGDIEGLKVLLNYCVYRHFPDLENSNDLALGFLSRIVQLQASLIAQWMDVGFIHGVMNTDNMLICGETIDYGPCAFMDHFSYNQVYSSIDRQGRYAFNQQPAIAQWNLARLADCLLILVNAESQEVVETFETELSRFKDLFEERFLNRMRAKLGLFDQEPEDLNLIRNWLGYLQAEKLDYTNSFRDLTLLLNGKNTFPSSSQFTEFATHWQERIRRQGSETMQVIDAMNRTNPIYIPRNHLVERAIDHALSDDISAFEEMLSVLENPYVERPGFERYKRPPLPEEKVTATFCGT